MADHDERPTLVPTSKTQIRRLAVAVTVMLWIMASLCQISFGRTIVPAILDGSPPAFLGFMIWFVYHLSSRRNNGIILIITPIHPYLTAHPPGIGLATLKTLVLLSLFAWAIGWWNRAPDEQSASTTSQSSKSIVM